MIANKAGGLDMGSCEVAMAMGSFSVGSNEITITNLKLNHKKDTVIPTEIKYREELFNYFKEAPKHFKEKIGRQGIPRKEVFAAFLAKVMEAAQQYNNEIAKNDNILLYVGCPASKEWTDEENIIIYEEMIKEATGVKNVHVVPESRAAMFSALMDNKGMKISAEQGTAVFDFGSLTVDFTYMKSGEKREEDSWNLGASLIEKNLRKIMTQKAAKEAQEGGQTLSSVGNFAALERKLRRAKEAYFDKEEDDYDEDDIDSGKQSYSFLTNEGEKINVEITIDDETMKYVLGEAEIDFSYEEESKSVMIKGSWEALCRKFFERQKKYLEDCDYEIQTLVLTGGASKMKFIADFAREIFPQATVICSNTPHYSVSNGLVYVAILDEVQDECVTRIKQKICEDPECNLQVLKDKISEAIGDRIYTTVKEVVNTWGESQTDESLNVLKKKLNDRMENDVFKADLKGKQSKAIKQWRQNVLQSIVKEAQMEVEAVLGNSLSDRLSLTDSVWQKIAQKNFPAIAIDTDQIMNQIDVSSLLGNILLFAAALIIATLFSPLAMVDGFLNTTMYDKTLEKIGDLVEKAEKALLGDGATRGRSQRERRRAAERIAKSDGEQMIKRIISKEFRKQFDAVMTQEEYESHMEWAAKRAFEVITLRWFPD